MSAGSALDRQVFDRLKPYPDLVRRLAAEIRNGARVDLEDLPAPRSPEDGAPQPAASTTITAAAVPIEGHHRIGRYQVTEPLEPRFAERVEQPLVLRFCEFLANGGYTTERVRYRLDGVDYLTDIVVRSVSLLFEAKYHTGRGSIRMAVGQIKDYDFMEAEATGHGYDARAALLGDRPSDSIFRYLAREGIEVAWAIKEGWAATTSLKARLPHCTWS